MAYDAGAEAALAADVVRPFYLAWLDFADEPIRVTTAPYSLSFGAGSGDPDIDGQTFDAIDATLISVSEVQMKAGGSSAAQTMTLSGLAGVDTDTLNAVGDLANYQGRISRTWRGELNEAGAIIGPIREWFTGYMSTAPISGDGQGQTISLVVDDLLSFVSQASGRTYLSQGEFDPDDMSPEAAIAIANGTDGNGLTDSVSAAAMQLGVLGRAFY